MQLRLHVRDRERWKSASAMANKCWSVWVTISFSTQLLYNCSWILYLILRSHKPFAVAAFFALSTHCLWSYFFRSCAILANNHRPLRQAPSIIIPSRNVCAAFCGVVDNTHNILHNEKSIDSVHGQTNDTYRAYVARPNIANDVSSRLYTTWTDWNAANGCTRVLPSNYGHLTPNTSVKVARIFCILTLFEASLKFCHLSITALTSAVFSHNSHHSWNKLREKITLEIALNNQINII